MFVMKIARLLQLAVFLAFISAMSLMTHADSESVVADRLEFTLPLGIPQDVWAYYIPKENPLTRSKVELGRELFFDKRLSADSSISCASCHDPQLAFTDGKQFSEGVGGRFGTRNAPSILNAMFNSGQFWDGRAATLEEQAKLPFINPDEMGNTSLDEVVARVRNIETYPDKFRRVFGGDVTIDKVAMAIAAYERTLVSADSPFDRFQAGDRAAMTDAAKRGLLIFRTKGRCNICHNINASFPFLTDQNYRNTAVAANHKSFDALTERATKLVQQNNSRSSLLALSGERGGAELGRFVVTGNTLDIGAFRTPSLRNVELTAPYFHDGSAKTLAEVVRYYVKGGNDHPLRDWELGALLMSDEEQHDLVEFLKSLTSDEAKAMAAKSMKKE